MAEKTHTGQRQDKLAWTVEYFTVFCSILRPNMTIKLPRGDMDTPPCPAISSHNWPSEYALLPSLEWHVWSSSSGNNCHAVHKSLPSGASLCDGTVAFLPCPILSAKLYFTPSLPLLPGPLWPTMVVTLRLESMCQKNYLIIYYTWKHLTVCKKISNSNISIR